MKSSQKKFDVATAKKLIASYAEKVVFYMKDNQMLKSQIEDLKTTLAINKKMLYSNITRNPSIHANKILGELKNENNRLSSLLSESKQKNAELEKKNYKLQEDLNEKVFYFSDLLEQNKQTLFVEQNKLIEKENIIIHLKKELEKYYRGDYISTKELLIGDPDTLNTEINNELCESRELIAKYTLLLMEERKKNLDLEKKLKVLNEYIENKKKGKKIEENFETITMLNYLLTPSSSSSSSSSENEKKENPNQTLVEIDNNLDSPFMHLPKKITQKKYLFTEISEGNNLSVTNSKLNKTMTIPKLDFSLVMTKYQPVKKINIIETESHSHQSNDEYIDKLKFQIKFYKNYAIKYKKRVDDLNKIITMFKNHIKRNSKEIITTETTTTEENKFHLNKKSDIIVSEINDNTSKEYCDSMMNNVSMVFEEEIGIEEVFNPEEEFNYMIKEYNHDQSINDINNNKNSTVDNIPQ